MFKKEKPCEAGRAHAVLLALAIGSAHGAPSGRLDLDGVQEGSQGLPEGRGENFRGKVSDVRRDLPSGQELCHFVAEGVTVVFEEVVGLTSEQRLPQGGQVLQKDFFCDFCAPHINHRVWGPKQCPSGGTAGDTAAAKEELILVYNYGRVPDAFQLFSQHDGAELPGQALGQIVHVELHRIEIRRIHRDPWRRRPRSPSGTRQRLGPSRIRLGWGTEGAGATQPGPGLTGGGEAALRCSCPRARHGKQLL